MPLVALVLSMREIMKNIIYLFFLLTCFIAHAQKSEIAKVQVDGEDTLAVVQMNEVVVFSKREFKDSHDRWEFERLKKNTIKVYPYVKLAVDIYQEINEEREGITRKRKERKYINNKEEDLREQFETQLRDLTKSQGKILIQLINRETGNNCYAIIKDLKNPITAFFWNVVGKRYGYDLKEEYKPEENQDLEFIVKMLKNE